MASTDGIAPNEVLNRRYLQCLAPSSLAAAVTRIAEHAGEPTIVHCAAGKDRTGVVAALGLSLLGVTESALVDGLSRQRRRDEPDGGSRQIMTTLAASSGSHAGRS